MYTAVCMQPAGSITKASGLRLSKQYPHRVAYSQTCNSLAHRLVVSRRRKSVLGVTQISCCSYSGLQAVFVATEVAPWSKVGGLSDVTAALPQSLAARGHAVMTVTPRYQAYPDAQDTGLKVPLRLPVNADARSERQLSHIQHCQQPNQPKCTPHPPLQGWATLYHCCQNGVDRVFVDHPLFLDTYGNNNANTYLQGGSQIPDLDLQYSILCQAALAAPILLWHQPQDHLHRLQLQALVSKVPQTLCGGVAQYIGLHAASLAQQNSWLMNADKASQPSTAGWRKPTVAGPVMLTGDIACSMSSSQSCPSTSSADSLLKEDQQMTHSELSGIMWPASVGNIAFVGNDWPCFPLSQHLHRLQSPGLESEGRRQALSGALQASTQPACSAANNFETHMARLLKSARVAFCIHNLAYQGIFAQDSFDRLCLPASALPCLQTLSANSDGESHLAGQSGSPLTDSPASNTAPTACQSEGEDGGKSGKAVHDGAGKPALNWLQGALLSSDSILTVSKSYAHDITHDPDAGCGLHHVLSITPVRGIMNGIDVEEWNPESDRHLPAAARYTPATASSGKAAAKAHFQQRYGLAADPGVPLVGMVGRLAAQKGTDVVLAALPALLECAALDTVDWQLGKGMCTHCSSLYQGKAKPLQIALLGSGDSWMEVVFGSIGQQYPGKACGMPLFNEEAAHLLLAAADYLLVPSRFEPCGLVALYALRYGAVPVVTTTGGLRDIVNPEVGYLIGGIGEFGKPADLRRDAKALAAELQSVIGQYGGAHYRSLQQKGMGRDACWDLPAQEWEQTLQHMLET